MKPGATATSIVTVAPSQGFSGTVSISTAASPNGGLTSSLDATSIAVGATPVSSVLTLHAHAGGNYKVTVRASVGELVRTITLTVPVNDFAISVSPSKATVPRGTGAHFKVTLTPAGSLSGAVTLAVGGLRTHSSVVYAHNPATAPGSQTITVTTSRLDARGVVTLRIRGVRGSLVHTALVTLTIK
jgi:hypothetical protein